MAMNTDKSYSIMRAWCNFSKGQAYMQIHMVNDICM